jgi:hypothetical protein
MALVFKNEKDRMLFTLLHPALIMIYCDLYLYAKEKHNIELVITETITTPEHDKRLGRVSDSHTKGIALDIRANDLEKKVVKDLVEYINTRWVYKKYHYMARSGAMRLALDHGEGDNYHIHLAIHQKYGYNINIAGL